MPVSTLSLVGAVAALWRRGANVSRGARAMAPAEVAP